MFRGKFKVLLACALVSTSALSAVAFTAIAAADDKSGPGRDGVARVLVADGAGWRVGRWRLPGL